MKAVLAAAYRAHGHVASEELLLARAALVLRYERLLNPRREDTLLEPLPGRRRARIAAAYPCGEHAARQRRHPHRQDRRSWEPTGARLASRHAATGTRSNFLLTRSSAAAHENATSARTGQAGAVRRGAAPSDLDTKRHSSLGHRV